MPGTYSPPHHYIERPIEIELIRSMVNTPKPKPPEPIGTATDGFITKTADEWLTEADKIPESRMLFDRFWYENELCILFADTNTGKSILAVQIADAISRQGNIANFEMTAPQQTVLYLDLELSAKQFSNRYSSGMHGMYQFNPNFLRASLNPNATRVHRFKNHGEFLLNALENAILNSKAKVLIIDNITCLGTGTQSALSALNLMRKLQEIKATYRISVLVLAHTPKRNAARPISRNDLQGSKMLINFCDSAFAIGESCTRPGMRYLKQIKQRNSAETYGAANICLGSIIKPFNFLHFEFTSAGKEEDHLLRTKPYDDAAVHQQIAELHVQGSSLRKIAAETGVPLSRVHRVVRKLDMANDA